MLYTPLIAALAAALALAAAHPHPHYSVPHSSPPCVPTHTPCSAATWCCGAQRCTPAPWDHVVPYQCLPSPPVCYRTGARCAGAPNYPFVPYAKCCGGEACVEDATKGWGRWCVEGATYAPATYAPATSAAAVTMEVDDEAVASPEAYATEAEHMVTTAPITDYSVDAAAAEPASEY